MPHVRLSANAGRSSPLASPSHESETGRRVDLGLVMLFFSKTKKRHSPTAARFAGRDAQGNWVPATVFFAHPPPGVVHLVVRPGEGRVDGLVELDAASEIVPVELRQPNARVEVLLREGRVLGVRPAGPGAASWFAQSRELEP